MAAAGPTVGVRARESLEKEEYERLAPWASKAGDSAGRIWPEPEHTYRTCYHRDRDRIVHSSAFRRLEYKTQVFVHHEGDHDRNRLTHTLEGAQIARTMARALRLNEDLAETIALAHDLGHPPFGHAGERVMGSMLAGRGGFDHNRQTLRVVDWLERRYPAWPGLNLTDETREGILKHGFSWEHPVRIPQLGSQRSLEAQVANLADEIAYMNHDLDDALRAELIDFEMLSALPWTWEVAGGVARELSGHPPRIRRAQTVLRLINDLVTDAVEETARRIERAGIRERADVLARDEALAGYSEAVAEGKRALKGFLYENFYNHPRVLAKTRRCEGVIAELFGALLEDPSLLPEPVRARFALEAEERVIADYVAGMTDRFAISEHERLIAREGGSGAR